MKEFLLLRNNHWLLEGLPYNLLKTKQNFDSVLFLVIIAHAPLPPAVELINFLK